MRMLTFSSRCAKEILRDPINLVFGLGFPLVLMALLSAMQSNIPTEMFHIAGLAPGLCIFGLSFITLFSATLIAKDRDSALLQRLYTTALSPSDFILGYMLPLIPMAMVQSALCYAFAMLLGLPCRINIIYGIIMILPISVFYISLGLLCGSILNVKQVGGVCGALLTNLSAWLSGIWFDLELVGDVFVKVANLLPFVHAVELERAIIKGEFSQALLHIYPVVGYAFITTTLAVMVFLRQMNRQ